MTPKPSPSAKGVEWEGMSESQRIEWLGEFMGWVIENKGDEDMPMEAWVSHAISKSGKTVTINIEWDYNQWHPLADWNHWRQVEERVMENDKLWTEYVNEIFSQQINMDGRTYQFAIMAADLHTRAKALYLAYSSLQ